MATKKKAKPVKHVDLGFVPHVHQVEFFKAWKQFNVLACTRRFGKSVIGCLKITDTILSLVASGRKKQPKGAYIAPIKDQARQISWPVFKEFLKPLIDLGVVRIKESEMEVIFLDSNGKPWGQVKLYGTDNGNAESIRGNYLDCVVLDEFDSMDADDIWDEIVSPTLEDTDGWALIAGSIKGKANIYNMIKDHRDDPDYNIGIYKFEDCWRDLPAYCDYDEKKKIWVPAPRKYERIKRRYKNKPNKFGREYQVDFSCDGEDPLIPNIDIENATHRHLRESEYESAPRVMGVDVAGDGPDSHTICKRQGRLCEPIRKLSNVDERGLSDIVGRMMNEWEPDMVFIDHTGGYGTELLSRLREQGFTNCRGINFGSRAADSDHYADIRTEMYHGVRDWLGNDYGALPDDEDLAQELSVLSCDELASGKARLMKKDDIRELIGRSPDKADALALTFAAPVKKVSNNRSSAANRMKSVHSTGYSPLNNRFNQQRRSIGYGIFR